MSAQHTPGPWQVVHDEGEAGCRAIFGPDESGVCSTDGRYDDDEDAANARLIAAAPELLEALQRASNTLAAIGDLPSMRADMEAAIAKATGITEG